MKIKKEWLRSGRVCCISCSEHRFYRLIRFENNAYRCWSERNSSRNIGSDEC